MGEEMEGEAAAEVEAEVLPPSRSEIDTKAPFQSVKEAVRLFGERVLAGELCPKKSARDQKHGENGACPCNSNQKLVSVMSELEETKQSLEMARQEATRMANTLSSLQSELQLTKQRLQQLIINDRAYDEPDKSSVQSPPDDAVDEEDLKFIEAETIAAANYSSSSARFRDVITMNNNNNSIDYEAAAAGGSNGSAGAQAFHVMKEFQKKRYVTFANPPCLDRVLLPRHDVREAEVLLLERNASLRRKKKKPFIPSIIGGIFSKKK